jgi:hypothetical protein
MRGLILILLVSGIAVAGSWEKEFIFSENDLSFTKVNNYDLIVMPDFELPYEAGSPLIPFYTAQILIPVTAELIDISVVDYDKIEIPGNYSLFPVQLAARISSNDFVPFVEPNDSIYSLGTEFPPLRLQAVSSCNKSGYRIASIFLYPISYIPCDSTLFLYTRLKVRIEYNEGVHQPQYLTSSQKTLFSKDVEQLVINPEDVNQYAPPVHQVDDPEIDYVIITSSDLTDDFFPLVNWLRKIGIWADTMSTTSIITYYQGRDLQEKMRNFIIDYFNNHGLKYVLLAGDNSIIPSRQARVICEVGTSDIPTDLYYFDLQWSWDGNHNNIFGERIMYPPDPPFETFDTVDWYYDLYGGRISVENANEVLNFITKLFTYEKSPDPWYEKRILTASAKVNVYYEEWRSQDSIARIASYHGWNDVRRLVMRENNNERAVKDSLNNGFAFGYLFAHGDNDGAYYFDDVHKLYYYTYPRTQTNYGKLTIVNAATCLVGNFEYSDCLAESMTAAPNCALAVMMNSRDGIYIPQMNWHFLGPSENLCVRFYDYFFNDTGRLAATHQRSKEKYVPLCNAYNYLYIWSYYEYNLFGEPYMPMWTDYPQEMAASFPPTIYIGPQNFTVTVTSGGNPVNNAQVCLWKENEIYMQETTNGSGIVNFNINPQGSGYIYVTVTAKNKLPEEDRCRVLVVSGRPDVNFSVINFQPGDVTINRVANQNDFDCWAVGDGGQVFKLNEYGEIDRRFTLNTEYNLTGVAFEYGYPLVGYIVGYKRDNTTTGPKWKGAIWKTTNGGDNWAPIDTLSLPRFPGDIPVPFLNVSAGNGGVVWVSCGHGYVIRSRNSGQTWELKPKPGGENHFGWLWGLWSDHFNSSYAWVCSDQSGLFANKSYLK